MIRVAIRNRIQSPKPCSSPIPPKFHHKTLNTPSVPHQCYTRYHYVDSIYLVVFAVSQIEHGVLYLVNEDDPRITVLMDCEGLSPIRFPMQMLKSCATILQDHYPNRLAVLFVIRLPPVSRVITQTFMKVLKPTTRQKLRIEGQTYHKVLSEFLQSVPAFLGGNCTCPKCEMLLTGKTRDHCIEESSSSRGTSDCSLNYEPSSDEYTVTEDFNHSCEHYLRAAVVGILMLWIIIAFLAGMYDANLSM